MTIDSENLLNSILESLDRIDYIKPGEIPGIDLYMDQVTTFMESKLRKSTRNPEEDKVLTKTMINNYAKNDLLPPPIKKKYSKEHVLLLIFIYYYKGIMSINDIQTLLSPITEKYFQNDGELKLEDIYEEVFSLEKEQIDILKEDVIDKYSRAMNTFSGLPEKDSEFLQKFSFICMLSVDVYVKKMIIEKMIDDLNQKKLAEMAEKKNKEKEAKEKEGKESKEKESKEK